MITHGNKQISEIVYARKASDGGGAVRLTNMIRGAQVVFGGLKPSFVWLEKATKQAILGAFGQTDGIAVINATNAYLNQLAVTDSNKATALAGFINEDNGIYAPAICNAIFDTGYENVCTRTTSSNGFDTGFKADMSHYHLLKCLSTLHDGKVYYGTNVGQFRFFGHNGSFYLDSGGKADSSNRISGGSWTLNQWYYFRLQFKCVYNQGTGSTILGSLSNTSSYIGTDNYKIIGEGQWKDLEIRKKADNSLLAHIIPVADNKAADIENMRLIDGTGTYSMVAKTPIHPITQTIEAHQ